MASNRGAFIIIIIGIFFLISNLGLLPNFGALFTKWWPLILIFVGVMLLLKRRNR